MQFIILLGKRKTLFVLPLHLQKHYLFSIIFQCSNDKELLEILKGLSKAQKGMAEFQLELKGASMDLEVSYNDHANKSLRSPNI